jgi:hypothetical protein
MFPVNLFEERFVEWGVGPEFAWLGPVDSD